MKLVQTAYAWSDEGSDLDFVIDENGVLTKYQGSGGDVVIPDGVTSIGDYAFYECENLTKVTLPESVETIGRSVFYECENLTEVTLPESLETIGDYAFYYCRNLTGITLPEGLTSIGANAFWDCDGLKDIIIPGSVTSIGDNAFYDCDGLRTVVLNEGVNTIGSAAFSDCGYKCRIVLPSSLTEFGTDVFENTSYIFCIKGSAAESYVYNNSNRYEYYSMLDEDSLTILYTKASLGGSESLKVTDISDSELVQNCAALNNANIALAKNFAVEQDDKEVSCDGQSWISIPSAVEEAGIYQLYHLSEDGEAEYIETMFLVPEEQMDTYLESDMGTYKWKKYSYADEAYYITDDEEIEVSLDIISLYIEIETEELGNFVLADSEFVIIDGVLRNYTGSSTNVVVPKGVTEIAKNAFSGNKKIESIVIPDSVETIDAEAFSGCTGLTEITLPNNVTIGEGTFNGCTGLTEITLPNNVTIGEGTFNGCSGLKEVVVSEGVTELPARTFYDCSSLESITLPESLTTIGERAFYNCSSLLEITFPEALTSIGEYAFSGCSSLTEVELPENVTSVGDGVFYNCSGLKRVNAKSSTVSWGLNVFFGTKAQLFWRGSVKDVDDANDTDNTDDTEGLEAEEQYIRYTAMSDDTSVLALLDEELASQEGIFELTYTDLTEDEEYAAILEKQGVSDYKLFDIALTLDGEALALEEPAIVSIKVPETMDQSTCHVYRLEEDGSLTDMEAALSQGYLAFETDSLGLYVVTCDEVIVPDEDQDDDTDTSENDTDDVSGNDADTDDTNGNDAVDADIDDISGNDTDDVSGNDEVDADTDDTNDANDNDDTDTDDNPSAGDVEDNQKTDILYGDVNDDGAIDAKDAVLLKRYCANWTVTLNETAADANQDGTIDTKDAVLVRRCAAGWNVLGNQTTTSGNSTSEAADTEATAKKVNLLTLEKVTDSSGTISYGEEGVYDEERRTYSLYKIWIGTGDNCYITTYNQYGDIIQVEQYNGDHFLWYVWSKTYDDNGNKIKEVGELYALDVDYECEYEYDDDNKLIKTTSYDEEGNVEYYLENEYNTDGMIIDTYKYTYDDYGNLEKNLEERYEYEYDGDGNCIKETKYTMMNGEEVQAFIWEFEYDEAGHCIKDSQDNVISEKTDYNENTYEYDNDGNLVSGEWYCVLGEEVTQATVVYDEKGNITKENKTYSTPLQCLNYETLYEYDDEGYLLQENTECDDGTSIYKEYQVIEFEARE